MSQKGITFHGGLLTLSILCSSLMLQGPVFADENISSKVSPSTDDVITVEEEHVLKDEVVKADTTEVEVTVAVTVDENGDETVTPEDVLPEEAATTENVAETVEEAALEDAVEIAGNQDDILPVVGMEEMIDEIVETPFNPEDSLVQNLPATFGSGTLLSIDSISDPRRIHIRMINKPVAQVSTFQLEKSWEDVQVLRETKYIYNAGLEFDNKYRDYRESYVAMALEKLFFLTKDYEGTILLDEYKNFPLWNVVLKDAVELRQFLTYLEETLAQRGRRTFDHPPVLSLILSNDTLWQDVTIEDMARMQTLFNLVHLEDSETKAFFNKALFEMDQLILDINSGSTIKPGRKFRQQVMDALEKHSYGFKMEDLLPGFVIGTAKAALGCATAWYVQQFIGQLLNDRFIDWKLLPAGWVGSEGIDIEEESSSEE